jgi:SAM-dependent methyltransferase
MVDSRGKGEAEWFQYWFDSPYYHLLYKNRNEEEAGVFIKNLCDYLQLPEKARVWDLACGKGRHAVQMNSLGYMVTGTDLAPNSILEASQKANSMLDFYVHDMRTPFRINYFDAVFNLFTSIGYFSDERDNFKVFEHVYQSLKPGGVFALDFLNASLVKKNLVPNSVVSRDGFDFNIKKSIQDNKVVKHIEFETNDKRYYFEEVVSLFDEKDFDAFAVKAGFEKGDVFGDYHLNPFHDNAERLILIYTK